VKSVTGMRSGHGGFDGSSGEFHERCMMVRALLSSELR
jgi:hypothetical protein